jgi:hypothetical protein
MALVIFFNFNFRGPRMNNFPNFSNSGIVFEERRRDVAIIKAKTLKNI